MNIYPENIMENVRMALGLDSEDESMDMEIMEMNKSDVLGLYLQWEGIIDYELMIIEAINDIYDVYLTKEKRKNLNYVIYMKVLAKH